MNIFSFSLNCEYNAKILDNRRLNKMIVETAQMLSTYFNAEDLYKPCYQNHPCNKWLRESKKNVVWLNQQLINYLEEYQYRFEKIHKTDLIRQNLIFYIKKLKNTIPNISKKIENIYIFPECFSNHSLYELQNLTSFEKYNIYIKEKWQNDLNKGFINKWTKREKEHELFCKY